MRFPKWGWVTAYFIAAGASTVMAGINMALNTYVPGDAVANYMYMTEPPKVDNPFVFHDLAWPWYVLAAPRRVDVAPWSCSMPCTGGARQWRGQDKADCLPLWQ